MKMRFAGRKITPGNLAQKTMGLIALLPRFTIFKNPIRVFFLYAFKGKKQPLFLELTNGLKIFLSSHQEDIVTTVVVCCKQDYGIDFANKNIIDIGANIGAFSLFAAYKGAKKIAAIEPGKEAFETFEKSVKANDMHQTIMPIQAAVTANNGDTLNFSANSSPNNHPLKNAANTIAVNTITLKTIVEQHFAGAIDLLKIDCEGGEYDILYNAENKTLARIREIRMELHGQAAQKTALLDHLRQKGFKLDKYEQDIAWLTNTRA
ncbi:MAG: FkbM family methyltransferase [Sphingobacteriales bacterium]|nr:MAG: FkbM family methyltransferase [Sphingobacteriales bacterium]